MLSVNDSDKLKAATLALKAANRDLKNTINRNSRATMGPEWQREVYDRATRRQTLTSRMLGTGARVAAGNPARGLAAQSKRGIGKDKRLNAATHYYIAEFGVDRNKVTTYKRKSKNGGSHSVTRHVNRGKPSRIAKGRVVYPAFAEIAPRMASLWTQTIVYTYAEAFERGGN